MMHTIIAHVPSKRLLREWSTFECGVRSLSAAAFSENDMLAVLMGQSVLFCRSP